MSRIETKPCGCVVYHSWDVEPCDFHRPYWLEHRRFQRLWNKLYVAFAKWAAQ